MDEDVKTNDEKGLRSDSKSLNTNSVEELIEIVNDLAHRARSGTFARSEFLQNIGHETRTPLSNIIGVLELLFDTKLTNEQIEYLNSLKASADSLLLLINNVLDFVAISSGKVSLIPLEFSLRTELCDAMRLLAISGNEKNIELILRVSPNVPNQIVGDPDRLRQVIVGLVGNAIKFTDEGEVVLTADMLSETETEMTLHFEVCDTGIGVPHEEHERIFKALTQGHNSPKRKFSGTGLGLSICENLIKLMDGNIWIESPSRPELAVGGGSGSSFHFAAKFGKNENSLPFPNPDKLKSIEGVPVLALDDNATSRRVIEETLRRWKTIPKIVSCAEEALAELARASQAGTTYRVALIDDSTPGTGGMAVAKTVEDNVSTAIITLNPRSFHNIDLSKKLGVAARLTKPVNDIELFDAVLRAVLEPEALKMETATPHSDKNIVPHLEKKLNILLVEDNEVNQKLAVAVFRNGGHDVTTADNGRKALDAVENEDFDLILMDVQMPVMDGLEATRAIRHAEVETGGHTPIVALTANAMKGDHKLCIDAGMDGYSTKPINRKSLFTEIKRVLADCANRGN